MSTFGSKRVIFEIHEYNFSAHNPRITPGPPTCTAWPVSAPTACIPQCRWRTCQSLDQSPATIQTVSNTLFNKLPVHSLDCQKQSRSGLCLKPPVLLSVDDISGESRNVRKGVWPNLLQLGVWGGAVSPPMGSGAEPRRQTHFGNNLLKIG